MRSNPFVQSTQPFIRRESAFASPANNNLSIFGRAQIALAQVLINAASSDGRRNTCLQFIRRRLEA
jgi:hypothetical protein